MNNLNISTEVMAVIEWGLVPVILLGILLFFLFYSTEEGQHVKIQKACFSGKLAGLVTFAIFILSQKNRELIFSLAMPDYDFSILIVSISIVAGSIFAWLFSMSKKNILIGVSILFAVAFTCVAIYCYLFIHSYKSHVMQAAIGAILGILIFSIFFPKASVEEKQKVPE